MSTRAYTVELSPDRHGASPRCFMHVPKSGGSSIHAALEAALSPGSLAPQRFDTSLFCDFGDFHLMRPETRSRIVTSPEEVRSLGQYRAVSGHFSLPTLLQVADAPSIATVLREPRARLLSLYMFWRTPAVGELMLPYDADAHAQRPLWEFLSEPLLAPSIDNQVCRLLLHGDPRLPVSDFAAVADIESIAADAIERLDTLGFVGILDSGRDLWRGLARLFGVELTPARAESHRGTSLSDGFGAWREAARARRSRAGRAPQRGRPAGLRPCVGACPAGRPYATALPRRRVRTPAGEAGRPRGGSAARASEQAGLVTALRGELEARGGELEAREQSGAPGASIAPRARSLLPGWSVDQVWAVAFILTLAIAVTDAILTNRIILIALLVVGPLCGLLTGRWVKTATVGVWSVALAVMLGFPDEIWGTRTQLIDVGVVVVVSVLSAYAATLVEKRQASGRAVG